MITTKRKSNTVVAKSQTPGPALPGPRPPSPVQLELLRPGARRVYVAGSFNDWKPDSTPLASAGNGRWVGKLDVRPGRYEYLFVVDGQWLPDPKAPESVQNPYGGRNSVLTVSE
jgi:1,4-alpha-glucan branching enzyme